MTFSSAARASAPDALNPGQQLLAGQSIASSQSGGGYTLRMQDDGNAVVLEWVRATPEDYEAVSEVTLARLDLANPTAPLLPLGDPSMGPETAVFVKPRGARRKAMNWPVA